MNLTDRVRRLEQQAIDSEDHVPGLVYWPQGESFEEAKARYQLKHGFSLPADAPVVELVAVDASQEGNNRELSPQEFKEACAG